jgi:hypothetical protein
MGSFETHHHYFPDFLLLDGLLEEVHIPWARTPAAALRKIVFCQQPAPCNHHMPQFRTLLRRMPLSTSPATSSQQPRPRSHARQSTRPCARPTNTRKTVCLKNDLRSTGLSGKKSHTQGELPCRVLSGAFLVKTHSKIRLGWSFW